MRKASDWEIGTEIALNNINPDKGLHTESLQEINEGDFIIRYKEPLETRTSGQYMNEHTIITYREEVVSPDECMKLFGRLPETGNNQAFNYNLGWRADGWGEYRDAGMNQPNSIYEPMQQIGVEPKTIKAVKITEEIFNKLKKVLPTNKEGTDLLIEVDGQKHHKLVCIGFYITDEGFMLPYDLRKNYELKTPEPSVEPIKKTSVDHTKYTAPGGC